MKRHVIGNYISLWLESYKDLGRQRYCLELHGPDSAWTQLRGLDQPNLGLWDLRCGGTRTFGPVARALAKHFAAGPLAALVDWVLLGHHDFPAEFVALCQQAGQEGVADGNH